jgi:hypothetical protein
MASRPVRNSLAMIALIITLLFSTFSVPAHAEICKMSDQTLVECVCTDFTLAAFVIHKATCVVEGKGAMTCFALSLDGPWRCDEKMALGYTYSTPMNDCTFNIAGAGTGSGGGSARTAVFAFEHNFSSGSCASTWNRPPGYIISDIQFYRWNGSGWSLCKDSGWSYSNVSTWGWELTWGFGPKPPCPPGFYHTAGFGYQFNGFTWRGGYLQSDYLYISGASPFLAASGQDAPPPRAITMDELRPPKLPAHPSKGAVPSKPLPPGLTARASA